MRNPRLTQANGGTILDAVAVAAADIHSKALANHPYQDTAWHVVMTNTDVVGVLYVQETNFDDLTNFTPCVFNDGTDHLNVGSGEAVNAVFHVRSGCSHLELFWDATSGATGAITCIVTKVTKP